MENIKIEVKRKRKYWLMISISTIVLIYFSYDIFIETNIFVKALVIGLDIYFLYTFVYSLMDSIKAFTIIGDSVTIHRSMLKDIVISKDNLLSVSYRYIRVVGKTFSISNIVDKDRLLEELLKLLSEQDYIKALEDIKKGVDVYKSRDILEESERRRDKQVSKLNIIYISIFGIIFLYLIVRFIINMFVTHWALHEAIGGVLFWGIAFVAIFLDKSNRSNDGLYIVLKLLISVILSIIIAFLIYRVSLYFGVNLNNIRL